jgi:hypothetical protein
VFVADGDDWGFVERTFPVGVDGLDVLCDVSEPLGYRPDLLGVSYGSLFLVTADSASRVLCAACLSR